MLKNERVEREVARHCEDALSGWSELRAEVRVERPADVWNYVTLGATFIVSRRHKGDGEDGVYLSLGCECAWFPEEGLELVFREGKEVTKLGPHDGHLTWSDAFADPSLRGVLYRGLAEQRRQS